MTLSRGGLPAVFVATASVTVIAPFFVQLAITKRTGRLDLTFEHSLGIVIVDIAWRTRSDATLPKAPAPNRAEFRSILRC